MKVLFVLPEYGEEVRGGIARFYQHAIAGLRLAGCQVDVCIASCDVVPDDGSVRGLDRHEVKLAEDRLSQFALFPGLRSQIALAFAAYDKCLGGEGYDVVEVTDWGLLYVPWLAQHVRSAPLVVQLHGSPGQIGYKDPLAGDELQDLLTRTLEVAYLRRADDLQTPGLTNAKDWQRLLGRDVKHIPPAWPGSRHGFAPPATNSFGMVAARLQSWKGPESLCKAYMALGDAAPTILWVGGDHPFQSLKQSMSSYLRKVYPSIWGSKIIPLGSQSPKSTRAVQDVASFVIHPALWDVFGLAVVEAMESGKVVICSDQAGVSSLIEHGKNGFIYSGFDSTELAELIKSVSKLDAQSMAGIGERARQTIVDQLDVERITKIRIEAYTSLRARRDDYEHPWLAGVFGPEKGTVVSEEVLLDRMPLKLLVKYMAKRLAQRSMGKKRSVASKSLTSQQVTALLDRLAKRGAD